jgi:hypothetical protein
MPIVFPRSPHFAPFEVRRNLAAGIARFIAAGEKAGIEQQ